MADVSKVKFPDGSSYDLKDSTARSNFSNYYTKDQVVANPSAAGTTDLTKLQVGEKVYNVSGGGSGGTTVTPNPTTTTSDPDLSTIGIGDTNYNINAKKLDGHDVDDLTSIINAAYVPDVTVDSMNTAIETKVQEMFDALEFNRYYTGTEAPASDLGNDGDLYLQQ